MLPPLLQLKITQRTKEIEEQKVKLERVVKQILKLVKEIKSKKGSTFSAVEEVCQISPSLNRTYNNNQIVNFKG